MRLITEQGEVILPEDFSFEVEKHNPLFSNEGASTIPVTLPATEMTLSILKHPERLGREIRLSKSIPCILQYWTKHDKCSMLLDSVNIKDGISCSLAFTESELYEKARGRSLKDLFSSYTYSRENCTYIGALVDFLYGQYTRQDADPPLDFAIFPVTTDRNETTVRLLNEVEDDCFVYEARTVQEGDSEVQVPNGYGVTVFLYLHRFLELTFQLLGYTVIRNDFSSMPFRSIVVLNSCADTLCSGPFIIYSDLVPSMSVDELIGWLKDKFNAGVMQGKDGISIVLTENALTAIPDLDLTPIARDTPTILYPEQSRVVLKCDTSIELAEPAAESLPDLKRKYSVINTLGKDEPAAVLKEYIFRPDLGMYYLLKEGADSFVSNSLSAKPIGSNCYPYDRENAEHNEVYEAADCFVPEINIDGALFPYVGNRIHNKTSVENAEENGNQKLMICYAFSRLDSMYGNSQPYSAGRYMNQYPIRIPGKPAYWMTYPSLTPEGLYRECWKSYNECLLNSAPIVEQQIDFSERQLATIDFTCPKLLNGQKVMIKSISYQITDNGIICGAAKMLLLPHYDKEWLSDDPFIDFMDNKFFWALKNSFRQVLGESSSPAISLSGHATDGLQDYTIDDAPATVPQKTGVIEKYRQRKGVRTFKNYVIGVDGGIIVQEKTEDITWEEYFISAKAE